VIKINTYEVTEMTTLNNIHNNPELGSLATPCIDCGLEFTFQKTHKVGDSVWIGKECKTYTIGEKINIRYEYSHFGK